ncbi:hypothetical protein GCM10023067_58030 [Aminobacter aganoensis]
MFGSHRHAHPEKGCRAYKVSVAVWSYGGDIKALSVVQIRQDSRREQPTGLRDGRLVCGFAERRFLDEFTWGAQSLPTIKSRKQCTAHQDT